MGIAKIRKECHVLLTRTLYLGHDSPVCAEHIQTFSLVIVSWAMQCDCSLHNLCLVLGTTSNLKSIWGTQEDVHRLHANALSFYMRLAHPRISVSVAGERASWNQPVPHRYQEMTISSVSPAPAQVFRLRNPLLLHNLLHFHNIILSSKAKYPKRISHQKRL